LLLLLSSISVATTDSREGCRLSLSRRDGVTDRGELDHIDGVFEETAVAEGAEDEETGVDGTPPLLHECTNADVKTRCNQ
jgi:hypothetical protein